MVRGGDGQGPVAALVGGGGGIGVAADGKVSGFTCKRKPPAMPVVPKSFSYAKKVSSFGRIVEVCQPPERTKGGIKSG